ncbi:flavodoxin family protein [Solimonas flava]|uniref:flavodoxin family protein n=1 Tax=Solimonas flava TaxID=415849 RepID=UPI0003FD8FF8|nr:hypothetical protein [Solimonas flava]
MKDNLVVFYSRSGHTRRLAQRLAARLDADLDEIHELHPHRGLLGLARCLYDALLGREPPITAPTQPPLGYARVIVGGPVWADHVAGPVRSYLTRHADELRHVAFFCSCAHSGAQTLADMASLCDREPDATLMMTVRQIDEGGAVALDAFVTALQPAAAPAAPAPAAGPSRDRAA